MTRDYSLHEDMPMPDPNFPIKMGLNYYKQTGEIFPPHWHEQLEFLYFTSGKAIIECNSKPLQVKKGDLIVVNSNDLHQGKNLSEELSYYCIIADTSLLQSKSNDLSETKYITPIDQNRILFQNRVVADVKIQHCINQLVQELDSQEIGFELAIKSQLYQLLTLLLRTHVSTILSTSEYNKRTRNLKRFNPIFKFIENHYSDEISIDELAKMANLSRYHFCRLFKEITNKTVTDYINQIRINQSEEMLKDSSKNITEVATANGFNNLSYFSKVFKKYKKIPPSKIKN